MFLVLTIDTECDKTTDWSVRAPLSFRGVYEGIGEILNPLFSGLDIVPTYLLSPEVIRDARASAFFGSLDLGELGAHLHYEFVGGGGLPERTVIAECVLSETEERTAIVRLTKLFEERFGFRPRVFRAGRFGLGSSTLRILAETGYELDTSVTPFRTYEFGGRRTTHWGAPWWPYRADGSDFRRRGGGLWELPVTCVIPAFVSWPLWIVRRLPAQRWWPRRLAEFLSAEPGVLKWVRPFRLGEDEALRVAELLVDATPTKELPVVNIMFHNVEAVPGASPYAESSRDVEALLEWLRAVVEGLRARYEVIAEGTAAVLRALREGR